MTDSDTYIVIVSEPELPTVVIVKETLPVLVIVNDSERFVVNVSDVAGTNGTNGTNGTSTGIGFDVISATIPDTTGWSFGMTWLDISDVI